MNPILSRATVCIAGVLAITLAGCTAGSAGETDVVPQTHSGTDVPSDRERAALRAIRKYLAEGGDPDGTVGAFGCATYLTMACANDYTEAAKLLLDHGADIELRDALGHTPLQSAAIHGAEGVAALLRRRGASIDVFSLAALGDNEALRAMLREEPALAAARGPNGTRPLHWVGGRATAEILVKAGADVGAMDVGGRTPLHSAARIGRGVVLEWLAAEGADVDAADADGETPLHVCAGRFGEVDIEGAEALINAGAHLDVQDAAGETPLHEAVRVGNLAICRYLLDEGADVAVADRRGRTPLHVASDFGRVKCARTLLTYGAPVDAHDGTGKTPLHRAGLVGAAEVAALLIEHDAALDVRDDDGATLLHLLCTSVRTDEALETAQVLIDAGADTEARNRRGATPLAWGSRERLGPPPGLKGSVDQEGEVRMTVLERDEGVAPKLPIIRLLVEAGAEVNARDSFGNAPLHKLLAAHPEATAVLEQADGD